MDSYLHSLYDALCKEQEYIRQEHLRIASLPFEERIALGFCFPPLPIQGISHNRLQLRIPKKVHLHDGIEPGESISIFPPNAEHLAISAICSDIDPYTVEIQSRELYETRWLEKGVCCVQLRLDESIIEKQKQGILEAIEFESPLKNHLLNPIDIHIPIDVPNRSPLHTAQSQAIETFIHSECFSIIHGPPGTGKTHTIAHLCRELYKKKQRIWVLADSNAAVDHLCLAIERQGIPLLRMGSPFRIAKTTWHLGLYHKIEQHHQYPAVEKMERSIRKSGSSERWRLIKEKRALEKQIKRELVDEAQIIVCTLGSLYRQLERLPTADVTIIDEASQVIDPAIWTLVPFLSKLLLVGDPHQLGPVIKSRNPILESTLIQRKMQEQSYPMLCIQHRMHQTIQALVQPIYGAEYTAHPSVANHTLADGIGIPNTPLTSSQVLWIDTSGAEKGEERDPLTHSLFNETEIEWIDRIYSHLQSLGVLNIGIITPYSAQVQRLRSTYPNVDINTVSAFQGQEREVIICSFVRANFDGDLGFVADRERLTVSITRAKKLLICIGDISLLSNNKHFSALFSTLDSMHAIVSIWEEPVFLDHSQT